MINRRIFSHEHVVFRDSVRKWAAAELAPYSEQWRAEGMVPKSAWKKAGQQGYLCMWAGEAYGGAGMEDYRYDQILIEELLHIDSGFFLALHNRVVGPYLNNLATEEQKARWLPGCVSGDTILSIAMTEPGTGSDLAGIKTRAEDKGDYWLLNGAKTYISNGLISNLCVVAARTNPDSPHAIGLFVVEADMPGFVRGTQAQEARPAHSGYGGAVLPGREGAEGQRAGRADAGLSQPDAQSRRGTPDRCSRVRYACRAGVRGHSGVHHRSNGLRAAHRHLPELTLQDGRHACTHRRLLGPGRPLRHGACGAKLTAETAADAKLFTSEVEGWVVDECVQLHGGAGYMEEYEICRLYADARISRIYAGTSEIMKEIIGRGLGLDERKRS